MALGPTWVSAMPVRFAYRLECKLHELAAFFWFILLRGFFRRPGSRPSAHSPDGETGPSASRTALYAEQIRVANLR